MKITELLKQKKYSLSFEVFPPKTGASYEGIKEAALQIAGLSPAFMSVTYGAGGGTSEYTLELAKTIKETYQVPTIAHLTCVSSSRQTVQERIKAFQAAGIENIMALRGDIPADKMGEDRTNWDYHHATDLIREIRSISSQFCIGGACYPEVHPESACQKEDIRFLKKKAQAGCDFFTTQMFFDNNLFYNFLYKIREAQITLPVIAGIMPITNANQVKKAIKLSGSFMPRRFESLVDTFGSSPEAMKQAGIIYASDQIIDLFANGISHIHVYSMNKPDVARKIAENVSTILGREV